MVDAEPQDESRLRVVIVDDHALFRQGIIAAIGETVDIVGEAEDVDAAVLLIVERQPDVVLLDVHLPSGSGSDVITKVSAALHESSGEQVWNYLGLSVSDSPEDVLTLVRAGARGYVVKRIDGQELIDAVIQIAAGNAVFSPRLAGFVLDAFAGTTPSDVAQPSEAAAEIDLLTKREQEVMQHLARGYTYKEIGHELHISARTVESHASAVLRKLQLSNRHELTHWAARNRLV